MSKHEDKATRYGLACKEFMSLLRDSGRVETLPNEKILAAAMRAAKKYRVKYKHILTLTNYKKLAKR